MFNCKLRVINAKSMYFELRRFISDEQNISQVLTNYFGIDHQKANDYIDQHKLHQVDPETMIKVVDYCEKRGYTKYDILKNPILLRAKPSTLDQYYTVMTESGFQNITAQILSKFRTLCRRKVKSLKESRLIDPSINVTNSFVKYLTPCPQNFEVKYNDFEVWSDIHLRVLKEYLKWRLQTTNSEVERLVKTHNPICRKSFKYLCENIRLAEELGFTPEKMLKYGYILHAYPKHIKEVLEKYPSIAGVCMKRAMRMYPKLVTTPPSNIDKILAILKQHNIPDKAISKRMNVFHLSPETVHLRLKELERIADFKVLLHNPNILKLVVHHNRAKSRLSFLKELQLKCATVTVLGNDNIKFDIHIREGRDYNTSTDTYAFLKGILKKNADEFEATLKKHPYYLQVPLTSMQETYFFLKSEKITKDCMCKVIYILLYPKDKIKNSFKQVEEFKNTSKRSINPVEKLNLAIYFIEKEHHFTGDGVWVKTESTEECVTT